MTRRFAVLVGALVAAAALSSCTTFDNKDLAATVNGEELSMAELQALVESPGLATVVNPQGTALTDGERQRLYTTVWVYVETARQGKLFDSVTDADATQVLAAEVGAGWDAGDDDTDRFLLDIVRYVIARNDALAPDAALGSAREDAKVWISSKVGAWLLGPEDDDVVLPFGN